MTSSTASPPQLTHAILGLVHDVAETIEGPASIRLSAEAWSARFVSFRLVSPEPRRRAL